MLTEEQIELLGDRLVPIYQELEQSIIADIARRVKKTGRFTETAELMAKALKEKGYSPAQIQKEVFKYMNADADYQKFVSENTIEHKKEVQALIDQAKKEAITEGDKLVIESGNMSFNNDMSLWESAGKTLTKTSAFNELVTAMSIQTNKELKNLTKTLGFKGVDGFTKLQNVYQHELDLALLKITSGNYSSQQALDECVRRMAKSGLRTIEYSSGRTMQLDTAARLSIRTASTQLSGQISLANATENGEDLVEVSSHFGARSDGSHGPSDHAYWQGKVYSLSGRISKKESIRLGYVIRKLEDATGYLHNPLGLKGCNCRHDFYTFFEGISKPTEWPDEPNPTKWNGKEYTYSEATTKQRSMERNIRATKREIEAQSALGGDTEQLRTRIKYQTAEYKAFSENCGISAKMNRLRVSANSSNISKTKSYKNTILGSSGALNNKNDPRRKRRNAHAIKYYQSITNRNESSIIRKIAKNSGMSERKTRNIYNHVFINSHLFADGSTRKFTPDYDMSESFRRLLDGKNVKEHDIILLKHENLEFNLMKKYNMVYEDAHEITNRKFNYSYALIKFLEEVGN